MCSKGSFEIRRRRNKTILLTHSRSRVCFSHKMRLPLEDRELKPPGRKTHRLSDGAGVTIVPKQRFFHLNVPEMGKSQLVSSSETGCVFLSDAFCTWFLHILYESAKTSLFQNHPSLRDKIRSRIRSATSLLLISGRVSSWS